MRRSFITFCGVLCIVMMVVIHKTGIIKDMDIKTKILIYFPGLFPGLIVLPLNIILSLVLSSLYSLLCYCLERFCLIQPTQQKKSSNEINLDTIENIPDSIIPVRIVPITAVITSDIKQNDLDVKEIIPDEFYECKEDLEYDYYIVEDEKYNNIHTSQA